MEKFDVVVLLAVNPFECVQNDIFGSTVETPLSSFMKVHVLSAQSSPCGWLKFLSELLKSPSLGIHMFLSEM